MGTLKESKVCILTSGLLVFSTLKLVCALTTYQAYFCIKRHRMNRQFFRQILTVYKTT